MEKLTLQNPITINGKKVKTLTYDTDAITVGMFADAEARKLRATSNKGGGSAGACELDYSLHAYLAMMAIVAVNSDHRRQRPRAHQRPRRHGAYEDRPKFYYGEVGGTIRGKRLGELVRDYSRAFHTSVGELRRERLTDFLMEYYEAAEEAKRQRDKAASMPRNNFRKYRRR